MFGWVAPGEGTPLIPYRINKFHGPKQNDLLYVLISRYYLKLHYMPTGIKFHFSIITDCWLNAVKHSVTSLNGGGPRIALIFFPHG